MSLPRLRELVEDRVLQQGRLVADVLALAFAFLAVYQLYIRALADPLGRSAPDPGPYLAIAAVYITIACVVFWRQGLYGRRASVLNLWELETVLKGQAAATAILFALLFVVDQTAYSRIVIVGSITLGAVLVLLERRGVSALIKRLQVAGAVGQGVVIYGSGATGRLLMKKIVQSPGLGRTVIGFLDDHLPIGGLICCRIRQTDNDLFEAPVLGRLDDLEAVVERHDPAEILIVESAVGDERLREVLERCDQLGLTVGVVPNLGDCRSDQLRAEDLSAIPVLRPTKPSNRLLTNVFKRAFDVTFSVLLGAITLPLWLPIAIAIRLDSTGPVLFRQLRVGLGGEPFNMLKFRTMHRTAPAYMTSPEDDQEDPRITRVGRVLRKFGLDELPQLVNVVRGQMSLVGPRPEMPQIVDDYTPMMRQRLLVKPGITGLWQVSADRRSQIHENIEYDLYYVHHQSLLLDAIVLLETAFFTASLLFGKRRRGQAPAQPGESVRLHIPPEDDRYVLLALDQRHRDGQRLPRSWTLCVPAACSLSDRWPVRIVTTTGNAAMFENLVESACEDGVDRDRRRVTYAGYSSRHELRRLLMDARMVVSDLEHVVEWARDASIDTLEVVEEGVRWWSRNGAADPTVLEMSRGMPMFTAPVLAGERHSPLSANGFEPRVTGRNGVPPAVESQVPRVGESTDNPTS